MRKWPLKVMRFVGKPWETYKSMGKNGGLMVRKLDFLEKIRE